MKKTTQSTYKKYYNEEKMSAKDYRERGFSSQARDEEKHARYFKSKIKR